MLILNIFCDVTLNILIVGTRSLFSDDEKICSYCVKRQKYANKFDRVMLLRLLIDALSLQSQYCFITIYRITYVEPF